MPKPLIITSHARNAMMLRRVSIDEVLKIILHPEITDRSHRGVVRYFRGHICVVTADNNPRATVVKTVLYRYGDLWTDEEVRNRPS